MFNFMLEFACSLLMAMSIVFIIIELRARFDRSYLIFGVTNLLLAIFCAIDLWIQPNGWIPFWTRLQHVIAAFFPPFIMWYLWIMLRRSDYGLVRAMFIVAFCFSPLFFTDLMFHPSVKDVMSTPLYNFTFLPYMLACMVVLPVIIIRNLARCAGNERKTLLFHLAGLILVSVGGTIDLISIIIGHLVLRGVPSFSSIGLLLFGIMGTYVFTDRLTAIIRDREITFGKLQEAYREMEDAQELKELGQSTAFITHEIKNYVFVIHGYAQYLNKHAGLSAEYKSIVSTIAETAMKIADFSKEILSFSKAKVVSDKRPVSIVPLVRNCVKLHFPDKQGSIVMEDGREEISIHGDANKLEHVFTNIFKNGFEAGATRIAVSALTGDTGFLVAIEDDGEGCTEEQLGQLFKSFYTTKKNKGGTGLGMCIVRSIIEGHGGHISAYSKNLLGNGEHGLILNLSFPVYNEDTPQDSGQKNRVTLIKDGVDNLPLVVRMFQNVSIAPAHIPTSLRHRFEKGRL